MDYEGYLLKCLICGEKFFGIPEESVDTKGNSVVIEDKKDFICAECQKEEIKCE